MSFGGMNRGKTSAAGLNQSDVRYNVARQNQTSAIVAGRMAIKQCRSRVIWVEEGWGWSAWTWSSVSVCMRHAIDATAMRHTTSVARIFQGVEAAISHMDVSLSGTHSLHRSSPLLGMRERKEKRRQRKIDARRPSVKPAWSTC